MQTHTRSESPQAFNLTSAQLNPFIEGLKNAGFTETRREKRGESMTFQEFRPHNFLKQQQASLNEAIRVHHILKQCGKHVPTKKLFNEKNASVVSIYLGKAIKVVTNTAANEIVRDIYEQVLNPEMDVGI